MRAGRSSEHQESSVATMPVKQIEVIIANTIAVITEMQERRAEWRSAIEQALQDARQRGDDWQIEVDFYTAVLAILTIRFLRCLTTILMLRAVAAIKKGIAAGGIEEADDREVMMQTIRDFLNAENWEV